MIHPSAIIDSTAVIGKNVTVGPWTTIGPDVDIGDGCHISSHVVIKGPSNLGKTIRFINFRPLVKIRQTLSIRVSLRG